MNLNELETRIVLLMTMGVAGYSFVGLVQVNGPSAQFPRLMAPAFGFVMILFAARTVIAHYLDVRRGESA